MSKTRGAEFIGSADFYDAIIKWDTRLKRELPLLCGVFGPPEADTRILDAGCGTGRHAIALARRGYRVTGVDVDAHMLAKARALSRAQHQRIQWKRAAFDEIAKTVRGGYGGIYCIGNALAASGSQRAVQDALKNFARVLRPGGRLVTHAINFAEVKRTANRGGYVRGPQARRIGGREYLWLKVFHVEGGAAIVTAITLWNERGGWQRHVHQGRLCVIEAPMYVRWLRAAGFRVLRRLGSYAGEPFDASTSPDLIVVAERVQQ
jgi:SAM-dependent methyltransferase